MDEAFRTVASFRVCSDSVILIYDSLVAKQIFLYYFTMNLYKPANVDMFMYKIDLAVQLIGMHPTWSDTAMTAAVMHCYIVIVGS